MCSGLRSVEVGLMVVTAQGSGKADGNLTHSGRKGRVTETCSTSRKQGRDSEWGQLRSLESNALLKRHPKHRGQDPTTVPWRCGRKGVVAGPSVCISSHDINHLTEQFKAQPFHHKDLEFTDYSGPIKNECKPSINYKLSKL
uniref:Uncharacterized protein n=1 Tax=Molossus molossus TaxID=27622 RepID=A0A7J8CZR1_MOLMO|nr:hypothetical protein HJG59_009557 [Molossus molossus]